MLIMFYLHKKFKYFMEVLEEPTVSEKRKEEEKKKSFI